jgi:hypothetical protein
MTESGIEGYRRNRRFSGLIDPRSAHPELDVCIRPAITIDHIEKPDRN